MAELELKVASLCVSVCVCGGEGVEEECVCVDVSVYLSVDVYADRYTCSWICIWICVCVYVRHGIFPPIGGFPPI